MIFAYLRLGVAALIPVIAAVGFYYLEKNTKFVALSYAKRQVIIGFIFGIISIMGTEFGIPLKGVVVNSRDAAPLVAGMLFGGPAGIIAGIMGGVERWFAVYWGIGYFTRVACSVSTIISGFLAAFIRKFMLDDKKPTWGLALGTGLTMEVFHLCMVFITNYKEPTQAIFVINTCFRPMVIAVGASVGLSAFAVSKCADGFHNIIKNHRAKTQVAIFETIQKWLLIVLTVCFFAAMLFFINLEINMAQNQSELMLDDSIREMYYDIEDCTNDGMVVIARIVSREIAYGIYDLGSLMDRFNISEINVVDKNGIVIDSSIAENIGFDMSSGEQSSEFLCLLEGKKEYVQPYGSIARDKDVWMKYAGVTYSKGFVQIAYDGQRLHEEINDRIVGSAKNRQIGSSGGVIVCDEAGRIVSYSNNLSNVDFTTDDIESLVQISKMKKVTLENEGNPFEFFCKSGKAEGYSVIAVLPTDEAIEMVSVSVYVSLFIMILLFALTYVLIYLLIKKIVVEQIAKMAKSLAIISDGNLDEVVNVRTNKEFASLSDDINSTVNTLKRYIAEAAARIDKELEFAKSIQMSAMPAPQSLDERYEIYARMDTAKEVGGDFYDFYMTRDGFLHFLIADVSGKGIPAAMFMMRAKSILKSFTERGLAVDDVFTAANNELCSENDAGMFVTAWQGSVDLASGQLYFANAGHNLPAIKRQGGKFEYLKQKVNLVLAGMEDIPYGLNENEIHPGDIIFLYTDGVTEATNAENELYGDDRLIEALNAKDFEDTREICDFIMEDVNAFVKDAPQFDDITMVCLKYKGLV